MIGLYSIVTDRSEISLIQYLAFTPDYRPPLIGVFNDLQSRDREKLDLDLENDMDDVMSCSDDIHTDGSQNGGDLDGLREF